jgi:hypothetical protein
MMWSARAPIGTGAERVVTDVELPLRSQTASSRTSVAEVAYVMRRGPKRAMTANNKVGGALSLRDYRSMLGLT